MSQTAFGFVRKNEREGKPRSRGITEIRGPYYSAMGKRYLQDVLETMGEHVDSLKFAGGSLALMPEGALREIIDLAHRHDVLVSTGSFIEYVLTQGPDARTRYWLIARRQNVGMEVLTVRLSDGGRALPVFGSEERAGAYLQPRDRHDGWREWPSGAGEIMSLLYGMLSDVERVAFDPSPEAFVEVMDGVMGVGREDFVEFLGDADQWKLGTTLRKGGGGTNGRRPHGESAPGEARMRTTEGEIRRVLGHFATGVTVVTTRDAAEPAVFEWYVKNYGPEVNLFVDHSQIVQLETLRRGIWGTKSTWARVLTYKG